MAETTQCGSDNHDGGLADAVVIITPTNTAPTARCLWCAESLMTHLIRTGTTFTATPIITSTSASPAEPAADATHWEEIAVSWDEGLVLHAGDADWHPWDESVYGPYPGRNHDSAATGGVVIEESHRISKANVPELDKIIREGRISPRLGKMRPETRTQEGKS